MPAQRDVGSTLQTHALYVAIADSIAALMQCLDIDRGAQYLICRNFKKLYLATAPEAAPRQQSLGVVSSDLPSEAFPPDSIVAAGECSPPAPPPPSCAHSLSSDIDQLFP